MTYQRIFVMMASSLATMLLPLTNLTSEAISLNQYGVHVRAKPGEIVHGTFELTNEKLKPIALDIMSTDLSASQHETNAWLELAHSQVPLSPGASTQLQYTVTIPDKATGQFLSRISFTERPANKSPSAVGVLTRVSIHIAATVVGTEIYNGNITAVEVMGYPTPLIRVTVQNNGNVYVKPRGSCTIFEADTTTRVAETTINRIRETVHIGRTERLMGALDESLPAGDYTAEISLRFSDSYSIEKTPAFTVPKDIP